MTAVRRSPWLNDRAELLVRDLFDRHDLVISIDVARHDLSLQLDHTAERMRIGRDAARRYITDEFIAGFADHIAEAVAEGRREKPVNLDEYRQRRRRRT